jgi:cyclophilin family peptidyl-prolyl cis-trans isomerase
MGRYDDPNSATSSFSFLLGAAPHLDMQYAIFGKVRGAPH